MPLITPDNAAILRGPQQPALLREEILADLFEHTAAQQPEQLALIFDDRQLRYGELDALADVAAHRLIDCHGVGPGKIVGLWLPRGIELLVLQLAIAKTGAAWLPLDAQTPADRVAVCLEDAQAVALVCESFGRQALASIATADATTISADISLVDAADLCAPLPTGTLLRRRQGALPDHTAYVIYTSGSTGKPKGIAISQRSICHFLRSENARLGVHAGDRVYQGFSVAFDMSFEEIWISYLVGATLWIGPAEAAGDPDLLPRLLADHGVTVLHAVPTLLALFAHDVPGLRLINLGGEMCPAALVQRWARVGRQVFNTYGPTEATVSASLAELLPGEPVTIGRPLPNYVLMVVRPIDDDTWAEGTPAALQLLPPGETGELCIAGPGVAVGYLGRPELTARKFLPNPWAEGAADARLYRTGDLACIDASGQVQCLGRTDDQVKIRGFRVELGEIEAVLAQQAGVGTAAVLLRPEDGIDHLVAYLVPTSSATVPEPAGLRHALAALLPPYMVPTHFELLAAMPRIPSGKIDRKVLRALPLAARPAADSDAPETAAEEVLFAALLRLFPGQPLRRAMDFFSDLGGHSLLAARLVSAVRADPRFSHATVRDLYRLRRVGALAAALQQQADSAEAATASGHTATARPFVLHSAWRRWRCGVAQLLVSPILVLLKMAQWLAPFFTYHFFTGDPTDSVAFAVLMSSLVFLLATVLEFVVAWAGKWLIAGRLAPGSHPLWGWIYFRWWLADRLVDAAPTYMIAGSSLYVGWLRALGARIGRDVMVGSITLRVPELLTLGDGASLGNAVNLENALVQGGMLHLGRIEIGRNCAIGSFCVLEGDVAIGDGAHLRGQTALSRGERVPPGRIWAGSPAHDIGADDPATRPARPPVTKTRRAVEALFFLTGALGVAMAFFLPVFPAFMLIDSLDVSDLAVQPLLDNGSISAWQAFALRLMKFFALALPASVVLIVLTALLSAGLRWAFLPRMQAGSWPVHSTRYLAKWLVSQIQESSLAVLHGIYATVYSATWYRLLGAKVGRDAELSTALGVVPDMLTLGDETFIADAVMLGDEQVIGGWMSVQATVIGERSFVGNGAYLPDGTVIPDNVLIGVLSSVPTNAEMHPGDTWLGSPPIHLPAREAAPVASNALTYRPTAQRRMARGLIEAFRIASPHALVIAIGYAIVLDAMPLAGDERWAMVVLELGLAGILFGVATFAWVAVLKWGLIGRYRQRATPMWTPFVWVSEAVTNMYEGIAVPNLLRYLRGTPMLPLALNLLGCRIAPSAWIDTTDITEFDCVQIGAHSELNAHSCPQTHLFEDRVMKIDHVRIGQRVSIGPRCNVLYGAEVGDDVSLGPLTLVMKGESLPAGTAWRGVPAVQQ
ncbi:MAG: Pls/PosA family non-ribosomal peptide synthetase [Ideonella sp.]